jgi:hypothetical protein
VDARADLWSAGAVMFQLAALCEDLPFDSAAMYRAWGAQQRAGAEADIGATAAAVSARPGLEGGSPHAPPVALHAAGPVRLL